MTYKPDPITVIFIAAFVALLGKVVWDWMKKGEYRTVQSCDECRQTCCVNSVKTKLAEHIQTEGGTQQRLTNIEHGLQDAKDLTAALWKESKEDAKELRREVKTVNDTLTSIKSVFEVYIKRADERDRRDRRTNGHREPSQ